MSHVDGCPACKFIVGLHRQFAQKEGNVTIFDAESVNLRHFNPHKISYAPKNINTEAIQVTKENIGQLALEFQVELMYNPLGIPFFRFRAHRGVEEDPQATTLLTVDVNNWLVVLWDELHVMHDYDVRNTFTFENPEAIPISGTPDKHGSMSRGHFEEVPFSSDDPIPAFQVPREDVEQTTVGSLRAIVPLFTADDPVRVRSTGMIARVLEIKERGAWIESVVSGERIYWPSHDLEPAPKPVEPPPMDLMEAAMGSSKPELRALVEKFSRPGWKPQVNDRVELVTNGYQGIVTVTNIEGGDGDPYNGRNDVVEVLFDSGTYGHFVPEELRAINE